MSVEIVEGTTPIGKADLSISQNIQSDNFIQLFLSQILNLDDASYIILPENSVKWKRAHQKDILPRINIPKDIWLNDTLSIKEIKVKTLMLQEINQLVESEINGNGVQHLDDSSLDYYEKLFSAYGFYETNDPSTGTNESSTLILLEEQEEEDNNTYNSPYRFNDERSNSNRHNSMISVNSKGSNTTKSSHRFSISSRENKMRFSILNTKDLHMPTTKTQPTTPPDEDPHTKQQALNNILLKSKLYNKIRRNRELVSSNSSNISHLSSYSNRNSITTTNTTTSNASRRRKSSVEVNDSKKSFPRIPQDYYTESLSPMKKQENQKDKYSYYVQCQKLSQLTEALLSMSCDLENVTKLLRFIKKKVLKFIILDIQQMILENARSKSYGNFRGCQ